MAWASYRGPRKAPRERPQPTCPSPEMTVTFEITFDTIVFDGEPMSLDSDLGALALMHGALQSAIGGVDEALTVEHAYWEAVENLPDDGEGAAGSEPEAG